MFSQTPSSDTSTLETPFFYERGKTAKSLLNILMESKVDWSKSFIPEKAPKVENQRGPTCSLKSAEIACAYGRDPSDTKPLPKARKHSKQPTQQEKRESKPFLSMRQYAKNMKFSAVGEILNIHHLEDIADRFGMKDCKAIRAMDLEEAGHPHDPTEKQYTSLLLESIQKFNTIIVSCEISQGFPAAKDGFHPHWLLGFGFVCLKNKNGEDEYFLLATQYGEFYLLRIKDLFDSNRLLPSIVPVSGNYYKDTNKDNYYKVKKDDTEKKVVAEILTSSYENFRFTLLTVPAHPLKETLSLERYEMITSILSSKNREKIQLLVESNDRFFSLYPTIPLFLIKKAIAIKNYIAAELLIKRYPNDTYLRDLFFDSIMLENIDDLQFLIHLGFDFDTVTTTNGSSGLSLAVAGKNKEIIEILLKHDATMPNTRQKAITTLLLKIDDIDAKIDHSRASKYMETIIHEPYHILRPLDYAIIAGSIELLMLLLDQYHLDINKKNEVLDKSPLDLAIEQNHSESKQMVEALLEHKADITALNSSGNTYCITAAECNNINALQLFLNKNKININHQNLDGETALHLATVGNKPHRDTTETIKILLRVNANPNIPNHSGLTPVSQAALYQMGHSVLTLFSKDDQVNFSESIEEGLGEAPIRCAANNRRWRAATFMLFATPTKKNLLKEADIDYLVDHQQQLKLDEHEYKLSEEEFMSKIVKKSSLLGHILNTPQKITDSDVIKWGGGEIDRVFSDKAPVLIHKIKDIPVTASVYHMYNARYGKK